MQSTEECLVTFKLVQRLVNHAQAPGVLKLALSHFNIKISEHYGMNQLKVGTEDPEDIGEAVDVPTVGEAYVKKSYPLL